MWSDKTYVTLCFLTMEHTCILHQCIELMHTNKMCLPGCSLCNYLPPYQCVFLVSSPLHWWSSNKGDGGGLSAARCALPLSILSTLCHEHVQAAPHMPLSHPTVDPTSTCGLTHLPGPFLQQTLTGFPVFNLPQGSHINNQCALSSLTRIRLNDMYNNITGWVYPLSGADYF